MDKDRTDHTVKPPVLPNKETVAKPLGDVKPVINPESPKVDDKRQTMVTPAPKP